MALVISENKLLIVGQTNVIGRAIYTPFETCSEDWELSCTVSNPALSATSAAIGMGVYNATNNRGYFAFFITTDDADRGKAILYRWVSNGTYTVMAKTAATTYNAGNPVDVKLVRTPLGLTVFATNQTTGLGVTVSTNFSYDGATGFFCPGAQKIALLAYRSGAFIDNLRMTNTVVAPVDIVVIGDSITEGYSGGALSNRWAHFVSTNFPTLRVKNYSASSASITNILNGTNELLRYRPRKALLTIGGNDWLYSYSSDEIKANYRLLTDTLTAAGVTVVHSMPSPRTATDLFQHKTFIATNYPAAHIGGTWTNLLGSGTSLAAWADSGDGVHPGGAGHYAIATNDFLSPLLP
ncbi:MAG: SGNH/GDSL hydrolase family protein [Akkermansiaceae bacterium]|nr:SGNH/GDSL hydrolase family protein [Verrucomicrobiales bacterium]